MPASSITAEALAKRTLAKTVRREIVPKELSGVESAGVKATIGFTPRIQQYYDNVMANVGGRDTVVYLKPRDILNELGPQAPADPLAQLKYQNEYTRKQLDTGVRVAGNVLEDGTLQLAGANDPNLLRFLAEQGGNEPVPVVLNFANKMPAQGEFPAFLNRSMKPVEYPQYKGASSGARVPPAALETPADLRVISNLGYLNSVPPDSTDFAIRANDILTRDAQSTIEGLVNINEEVARKYGGAASGAFDLANKLRAEGKSTREIWKATASYLESQGDNRFVGITTGYPDGKPRLEVHLPGFGVKEDVVQLLNRITEIGDVGSVKASRAFGGTEELFQKAPDLESLRFGVDASGSDKVNTAGYFDQDTKEIILATINKNGKEFLPEGGLSFKDNNPKTQRQMGAILHEFNHAVDSVMDFARGGNWGQVAPEHFGTVVNSVLEAGTIVAAKNDTRIFNLLQKHGFDTEGDILTPTQITELLSSETTQDNLPAWLKPKEHVKDYEALFGNWDALQKDIKKSKPLQELRTLVDEGDFLETLRRKAQDRYRNIYGEESANLMVYRTNHYPDVKTLRLTEPSAQMAGRNKVRNQIPVTEQPDYIDPANIKRIVDDRYNAIQLREKMRRAKLQKTYTQLSKKFFREEK